jgi:hypothetical protein
MDRIEEDIQRRLVELQEQKYKEFHCKLHADVNPEALSASARRPADAGEGIIQNAGG